MTANPNLLAAAIQAMGRQFQTTNKILRQSAGLTKADPNAKLGEAGNQLPVAGYITKFFSQIFSRVSSALSASNLANEAAASKSSGFDPFMQTIRLMGTVLSGFLTPGFVILGAAVYATATYFASQLGPILRSFYNAVADSIPDKEGIQNAVDKLEAAFKFAADAAKFLADYLKDFAKKNDIRNSDATAGMIGPALGAANWAARQVSGRDFMQEGANAFNGAVKQAPGELAGAGGGFSYQSIYEQVKAKNRAAREQRNRDAGRGDVAGALGGGMAAFGAAKGERGDNGQTGWVDRFVKGLDVMEQVMTQSAGAPARSSSLAGAAQQSQLAALNQNPIDKKILEVQQEILKATREMIAEMKLRLRPAIGI